VVVAAEHVGRDLAGDDLAEDAVIRRSAHGASLGSGGAAWDRKRRPHVPLP
jgi:hypothetical protein